MNDEGILSLFERLPDEEAREELVAQYTPLAWHLVEQYERRGLGREDVQQRASIGLLNAIDRYDPKCGTRFVCFAVPLITGELRRHGGNWGCGVGGSRDIKEIRDQSRTTSDVLSQKLGRAPTLNEIAECLEMPVDDVAEAAALATVHCPEGLNTPDSDILTRAALLGDLG